MVVEILLFSIRFDPPRGLPSGRWWVYPLYHSHSILNFLFVFTVGVCTFGGLRLGRQLRQAYIQDVDANHAWVNWFLAHGLALALLAGLTFQVCERGVLASTRPGLWIVAWMASVAATGATWLASLLSPSAWLEIVKSNRLQVAMAAAVGGSALVLGNFASQLWSSMAWATLGLVRTMLSLVSFQTVWDPAESMIGIGDFQVIITDYCSGYEGIGLVLSFLAGYFWFFRQSLRWPRTFLLLPLGVVLIWVLNSVRLTALVLIGAWVSPQIALGGFHSQAGWLAFLAVSLGLVAVSRRSPWFAADLEAKVEAGPSNPTLSFLGPFLAVLATALVTSAFSTGFDALYGLRVFTGAAAIWYFRRDFAGLLRDWSWGGLLIGVAAFVLWAALEPASTESSRSLHSAVEGMSRGQAWTWVVLRVIGSVAIVPVVEELAFRGYLTRRLISVDFESVALGRFSWLSLLISSAAFGLLHGRWLAGMLVGVIYALALYRRGKLSDAILAHAVTNALIAATVLVTGDWAMWA